MVKAGSLRKRYILFSGPDMEPEVVKRILYSEALKFFGEFGLSYAAIKLVSYDKGKRTGIIRCERTHLERVLGFLALINQERFRALRSSGTIKGLDVDLTQIK